MPAWRLFLCACGGGLCLICLRGACCLCAYGVGLSLIFSGLLASPLCGAHLLLFAAAKRSRQEKAAQTAMLKRVPWLSRGSGASGIRALAHSALVTKGSSAPTPHCVRRGWVCEGNPGLRLGAVGAIGFASAKRLMKMFGHTSSTLTLPLRIAHSQRNYRHAKSSFAWQRNPGGLMQLPVQGRVNASAKTQ